MSNENRFEEALFQETRDLLALAGKAEIAPAQFRDDAIKRITSAFANRRSALIVGPPGVGKSAVVYGLAHQMYRSRQHGLREISTMTIMSGTQYIGDWQTKAKHIIDAAKQENIALYFTDIWNLRTVGSSVNDPSVLLDAFRPHVLSGELLLLGEVTATELAAMHENPQLVALFEQIAITPLSDEQQKAILETELARLKMPLAAAAIEQIQTLCRQFMPHADGPGPALRLTQQIAHYQHQKAAINEPEPLDAAFVDKVFSIYSGLPLFIISRTAVKPAREMRAWFRQRLIAQEEAIESVLEAIALYKTGLHDARRPIGTFLFVGPTGVGKTELAKALAQFLFGSETRLLRFDMSEFKDYHAFELLVGTADNSTRQARLLDPVKNQPFQVILLDEIEKAHANIWDLLLQLLDEGRLTGTDGTTVNFRNTIVIATSNVGAQEVGRASIGFADPQPTPAASEIRKQLEQVFRPELINRFQYIVPFHGLDKKQVRQIAERELQLILSREGITSRNLIIEITDEMIEHIVDSGYDQHYGARALKRELQRQVVLPIANFLLEHTVNPGDLLKLDNVAGSRRLRLITTSTNRVDQKQPPPANAHTDHTFAELHEQYQQHNADFAMLCEATDRMALRQQLARHDDLRASPDFWADRDRAYQQIVQADQLSQKLNRLDQLGDQLGELHTELTSPPTRNRLPELAAHLLQWRQRYKRAWRELVVLGEHGQADAILQIQALGSTAHPAHPVRDLLYQTYLAWAQAQHYQTASLSEPLTADDPAGIWIQGPYVFGLLRLEAGIHRLRTEAGVSIARVTLAPLRDEQTLQDTALVTDRHQALKKINSYGNKIRSRLELDSQPRLVLQNANTLGENQELIRRIGPAWINHAVSSDEVIRRYQLNPFLIRDPLIELTTGKQDLLKPTRFNELLCQRVDVQNQSVSAYPQKEK